MLCCCIISSNVVFASDTVDIQNNNNNNSSSSSSSSITIEDIADFIRFMKVLYKKTEKEIVGDIETPPTLTPQQSSKRPNNKSKCVRYIKYAVTGVTMTVGCVNVILNTVNRVIPGAYNKLIEHALGTLNKSNDIGIKKYELDLQAYAKTLEISNEYCKLDKYDKVNDAWCTHDLKDRFDSIFNITFDNIKDYKK